MFSIVIGLGLMLAPAQSEKLDAETTAKIKVLQKERRDLLKAAMRARKKEFEAGRVTLDAVYDVAKRLLQAEMDMAESQEARVAAWAAYVQLMKDVEERLKIRTEMALADPVDYVVAQAARREAEIGWLKASGKEAKAKKEK